MSYTTGQQSPLVVFNIKFLIATVPVQFLKLPRCLCYIDFKCWSKSPFFWCLFLDCFCDSMLCVQTLSCWQPAERNSTAAWRSTTRGSPRTRSATTMGAIKGLLNPSPTMVSEGHEFLYGAEAVCFSTVMLHLQNNKQILQTHYR